MSFLDGIIDELNTSNFDFIEKNLKPLKDLNRTFAQYLERVNNVIKEYQETNVVPDLSCIEHLEQKVVAEGEKNKASGKNIKREASVSPPQAVRRTRRNALREIAQNVDTSIKSAPTVKTETRVKNRKFTIAENGIAEENTNGSNDDIASSTLVKTEMPAPTKRVPRKQKGKESKARVKRERIEDVGNEEPSAIRDSDVILEENNVSVINLVDSLEGEASVTKPERATSLGKKSRKRSLTSISLENVDGASKDKKRSKSDETTITNQTQFEDAISAGEESKSPAADATFVARKSQKEPQDVMNATVVVEHSKVLQSLLSQSVDGVTTEGESAGEIKRKKKSPPKAARAIPKSARPVLSPSAQSPVKQKVKAFEKLQEQANADSRVTRTQTRARDGERKEIGGQKEVNQEKAKFVTPVTSKFIPKAASTNIKSTRPHNVSTSTYNESVLSTKGPKALKAFQVEYSERERKLEAIKKKEALIQAQIEEKKRKREEKQLKAQQQRELLEKDKTKALEIQKLKEERHRKLIAEQEEKKQRTKEESEKKRFIAKSRAIEEKKKEEEKRVEEERNREEMAATLTKQDGKKVQMSHNKAPKTTPLYMKSKAPLLPTGDCYDSDDEEAKNHEYVLPQWNNEGSLKVMQKCAFAAGESLKNTFFSVQAQTPDLQDIFEVIEPKKLKRTSSAVWHKPPRFTMIPGLDSHDEIEEFDEVFE